MKKASEIIGAMGVDLARAVKDLDRERAHNEAYLVGEQWSEIDWQRRADKLANHEGSNKVFMVECRLKSADEFPDSQLPQLRERFAARLALELLKSSSVLLN